MPNHGAKTIISRRRWLGGFTAAMTFSGQSRLCAGDVDERHPYLDAHSHIWTRDVAAFPLAETATLEDLDPPSFTAQALLRLAHRHGVGRVVLIQHHLFHGWDNSYLIDAARRFPHAFRVVGMLDNFTPQPEAKLKRLLAEKVTGLRITPWIYQKKWLEGGMDKIWRTAAQTGQKMCCLIDPSHLGEVDQMCQRHPDTHVVVDHFARIGVDGQIRNADVDALCRLARHRHTYVKVSAFYALGEKRAPYLDLIPMIRRVLDTFGPQRLMWASDAPYQLVGDHTYAASIDLVRERLDFLSESDRQWLLHKTAEQAFWFV